jgi:two-component system phosphate regulon sensor histidine kinase PhoR
MFSIVIRLISILAIISAFAWVMAEFVSETAAWLTVLFCLGFLLFRQAYNLHRLSQLLISPSYGEVPTAMGLWGEVYYRLHKLVKSWRTKLLNIEQQHQRFIQAIEASPNGVIMLNEENQIEWCNRFAEQHFGLDAKRDTGQRIIHLLRKPTFVEYIVKRDYSEPVRLKNMGDAEQFSLDVQIFPYGDHQKLVLSQDVSQLDKTESMRKNFVANISHELKTPLTVLSGFLETFQELPLTKEEQANYLGMMSAQTFRMKALVDDLLVLANLEANPEPPAYDKINTAAMLDKLLAEAKAISHDQHQIELVKSSNKDILGDEFELSSAIINLISNAVRYTPQGSQIKIEFKDQADGSAILSVQDTGAGIAQEHIPRLTERFYRADKSRSRDTGGTGLGLAIVKHVIQRHRGELLIESTLGKGSQFSLLIPKDRLF